MVNFMSRSYIRRKLLILFLLGLAISLAWTRAAQAGGPVDPDAVKAMLRTADPEQDGFIERVVTLVNAGKLPRDIFDSTLLWARRKPVHRFQYFKQGLTIRAADVGVVL
jgi:hypothetical protein